MKRSGMPRRTVPLRSTKGLARKTGLDRSGTLSRTAGIRRTRPRDATAADAFADAVRARARGACEVCPILRTASEAHGLTAAEVAAARAQSRQCPGSGHHAHHVIGRGSGGGGDHNPENGLYACNGAHDWVHVNGTGVRVAYALGIRKRRTSV